MRALHVLFVDRSALAANMMRLLLSSLDVELTVATDLESTFRLFSRKRGVQVLICDSRVLGDNAEAKLEALLRQPQAAETKKVFLCNEQRAAAEQQRAMLERVPNAYVVMRPFSPSDVQQLVAEMLRGMR